MKKEDKQLLLADLCARLPYKVKVCLYEKETCILLGIDGYEVYLDVDSDSFRIESIKPYLRPMSSLTEEENKKLDEIWLKHTIEEGADYLNSIHVDYRGLIPKGLALEAPKDMYNCAEWTDENPQNPQLSAADRGIIDEIIFALNSLGKEKMISYHKEIEFLNKIRKL